MAKLHEIVAVEGSLKSQAAKARVDLGETFEKKRHHFAETLVQFHPFDETKPDIVTESQQEMQTTVPREIQWLTPFLVKAIDAGYQVAQANTQARADIVLEDGTVLAENLPATALLELEKRIYEVYEFLQKVPTLDPAKGFQPDPDRGQGIFRAREVTKTRTAKQQRPIVLYDATDKHPAQTQLITEDVPVGTIRQLEWSGLTTVDLKSRLLNRAEQLVRAIRAARSRANDIEVDKNQRVAKTLLDFVLSPISGTDGNAGIQAQAKA